MTKRNFVRLCACKDFTVGQAFKVGADDPTSCDIIRGFLISGNVFMSTLAVRILRGFVHLWTEEILDEVQAFSEDRDSYLLANEAKHSLKVYHKHGRSFRSSFRAETL